MSNSALEVKKQTANELSKLQMNSGEGQSNRKTMTVLQPVMLQQDQPSTTSLFDLRNSAAVSKKINAQMQSADDNKVLTIGGVAPHQSEQARKYIRDGLIPSIKRSSDQTAPQHSKGGAEAAGSRSSGQQQPQVILRFLSSDCDSSQSIFSSDSSCENESRVFVGGQNHIVQDYSKNNQNNKIFGEYVKGREILTCQQEVDNNVNGNNFSLTSRSRQRQQMQQQNAKNNQKNNIGAPYIDENENSDEMQNQHHHHHIHRSSTQGMTDSQKLLKRATRNGGMGSEPFFSSNAQNIVNSTFYGQKPKAIYQSLVHQQQNNTSDDNDDNDETNPVASAAEIAVYETGDKSRNSQILSSQTKLQKQGVGSSGTDKDEGEKILKRKIINAMPPMELTSVRRYYSLKPDMAFGWRPEDIHGAPIPMYFDYEQNDLPIVQETGYDYPIYYLGSRFNDSLDMHHRFANKIKMLGPDEIPSYHFKFPPNQNVMDAMSQPSNPKSRFAQQNNGVTKMFTGMSPLLSEPTVDQALPLLKNQGRDFSREFLQRQMQQLKAIGGQPDQHLLFDSSFESGNLDMVIQAQQTEYDCYMRVDSNTRGHHQWFYFKVQNQGKVGKVKFNFVNFTKRQSLYMHGMRVNVKSMKDIADQKAKLPEGTPITALKNDGWVKCGDNITYKLSKLSQHFSCYATTNSNFDETGFAVQKVRSGGSRKKYYQLTFEYTFKRANDEVYFAYALPYTFSKLHNLVKEVMLNHKVRVTELEQRSSNYLSGQEQQRLQQNQQEIQDNNNYSCGNNGVAIPDQPQLNKMPQYGPQMVPVSCSDHAFIKEGRFCYSLSGLEVPELTITSQVNQLSGKPVGAAIEIDPAEFNDEKCKKPLHKYKKYMIVGGRVHPGESNSSFIVQGFIKFITGQSPEAISMRKRIIFKVIPMTNPDGVIAGNYRTSLSGNDLNRQFLTPNPKLHPTVDNIKKLCNDIMTHARQLDPIMGFIDIHGHSRKKSVFMYGPHYPLHNERYLKSKILPKLLDDKTQMFRYYSCKFRIEKSKVKTARVVLFKEFGIMNCFTLEASFHGFIDKDRSTKELTTESLEQMGKHLGETMCDYSDLVDEDDRQKALVREALRNKKKKLKARDITKAIIRQEKSSIQRDNVTQNNNSDVGGNQVSNSDTDMDSATGISRGGMRPHKGVRSLSIQRDISTKVSSFSDTNQHYSDDGNGISSKKRVIDPKSVSFIGQTSKEVALTSDIMELISEEELSVCRSEGSPPRKMKKRSKIVVSQPDEDDQEEVQAVIKFDEDNSHHNLIKNKNPRAGYGNKKVASQKGGANSASNSNFRIRPERATKRLSEVNLHQDGDANTASVEGGHASESDAAQRNPGQVNGKKLTMSALMNQLKKSQENNDESDEDEQFNNACDDESSCGKSFSADELSEGDLKDVQGDILGAIRRFDDIYNKQSNGAKEKQPKQEGARKSKKTQSQKDDLKSKRQKQKREDLMQAAKNAQPAVTMPFQVKGSGNGGNSCTLVMERIMQQRNSSQQQPTAPFMSTHNHQNSRSKQQQQQQQPDSSFGFMQRHKKSLNPNEKGQSSKNNRVITDINFNVPKSSFTSSQEHSLAQKGKQSAGLKKRESSFVQNSSAPVGVKGLAAISELRNSTKNQQDIKRGFKSSERPAAEYEGKVKHSISLRQTGINKPARVLKPSNNSLNTTKSPTNSMSISGAKSTKIPKSSKPQDGPKKLSSFNSLYDENMNILPLAQIKQTPKAEINESLRYAHGPQLSQSQSKTIQAMNTSPENLPKVHRNPSSFTSQEPLSDPATNEKSSKSANYQHQHHQPPNSCSQQLQNQKNHSSDLEQPKIISMTINTRHNHNNNKDQNKVSLPSNEYQTNEMENANSFNKSSSKNVPNYRVKPNKKRSYLSGQRCSSGNVAQRTKVANLAKENSFLNKQTYSHITNNQNANNNQQSQHEQNSNKNVIIQQQQQQQQTSLNRFQLSKPMSRWPPQVPPPKVHTTQYQSFIQKSHRAQQSQLNNGQPVFNVIGLSSTRNNSTNNAQQQPSQHMQNQSLNNNNINNSHNATVIVIDDGCDQHQLLINNSNDTSSSHKNNASVVSATNNNNKTQSQQQSASAFAMMQQTTGSYEFSAAHNQQQNQANVGGALTQQSSRVHVAIDQQPTPSNSYPQHVAALTSCNSGGSRLLNAQSKKQKKYTPAYSISENPLVTPNNDRSSNNTYSNQQMMIPSSGSGSKVVFSDIGNQVNNYAKVGNMNSQQQSSKQQQLQQKQSNSSMMRVRNNMQNNKVNQNQHQQVQVANLNVPSQRTSTNCFPANNTGNGGVTNGNSSYMMQ